MIELESYGIQGHLLKWIKDILIGRRQRVVVNGAPANWALVVSGIPKGSILELANKEVHMSLEKI